MRTKRQHVINKVLKRFPDRVCCLCGSSPIQLHHNLIFAGKQVHHVKTILPVCVRCHTQANKVEVREKLDLIMLKQMTKKELQMFSKVVDLEARLKYLYDKHTQQTQ